MYVRTAVILYAPAPHIENGGGGGGGGGEEGGGGGA